MLQSVVSKAYRAVKMFESSGLAVIEYREKWASVNRDQRWSGEERERERHID